MNKKICTNFSFALIAIFSIGLLLCISIWIFNTTLTIENLSKSLFLNSNRGSTVSKLTYFLHESILATNKSNLSLMKNGEVIIEDISQVKGYPDNGSENVRSVYLWGESNDKKILGFSFQPPGGGLFYFPIYILDIENLEEGFQGIDGIFVYPYIDHVVSPDYSKIIGILLDREVLLDDGKVYYGPSDKSLYYFDLNSLTVNSFFARTNDDNSTVFFPGFMGEDSLMVEWKNNEEIIMYSWIKESFHVEHNTTDFDVGMEQVKKFGKETIINISDTTDNAK